MTTIRATCQECNETIEASHRIFTLLFCMNQPNPNYQYSYVFRCPICKRISSHCPEQNTMIARMLIEAGVLVKAWSLPELEKGNGPPISEADVDRFLQSINSA